jgi:pyruvate ferredoxin oxidoreductase alpha subunit
VLGTLKDAADELCAEGLRVGVLGLTQYRPFPTGEVAAALRGVPRVVILERAFAVGVGGIVAADLAATLAAEQQRYVAVAGLGGRPVTRDSLRQLITAARAEALEPLTFVDLHLDLIESEVGAT